MLLIRLRFLTVNKWINHAVFRQQGETPHCALLTRSYSTAKPAITLRPYQEESIQAVLTYIEKGHKRLGLSLATGSGKTVVFTQLIERITSPRPHATQTLILAHRQELVDQAYRHCTLAYPDKTIEIELGKNHASGLADITVASMQSITSRDRMEKFDPTRFKLVLVDEAHHMVSPKYLEILEYFNLRHGAKPESPVLVGVSATMYRIDGVKLGAALDHIVFHKDYIEMINEKWLSDVMFTTVTIQADLAKVKSGVGGDFQTSALSKAVNTQENNEATFLAWQERASDRKSTLIFCVDVKHIHDLTATFVAHGIDARFVTGSTRTKTRSDLLDEFRKGKFPVLLNCGVFTEGTDIPNIDCVLLARPTKSRNLLVQMIGRGTRLFPGKTNCHVIDMVSSLKTGVVTTPTLFGLDPDELVKDISTEDLKKLKNRKEEELQALEIMQNEGSQASDPARLSGTMTFTDYDSIEDLMEDTSGERHIRSISPFAWVQVDEHRYVLSTNNGSYLVLVRSSGEDPKHQTLYKVIYNVKLDPAEDDVESPKRRTLRKMRKSPFARPRHVASAKTFLDGVHAADNFAKSVFNFVFIAKNQEWRRGPASDAQLKFLNKIRGEKNQLQQRDVTKGEATDMIVKIKFGARGRFNKMAVSRNRVIRQQEKSEKMNDRGRVIVGPLNDYE